MRPDKVAVRWRFCLAQTCLRWVSFEEVAMEEATKANGSQLHAALDGTLGGYLRIDPASRALWSTDASIYQREPAGVVVARSEEDVKRAVGVARNLGLSITPRGTGMSLAGQATSPGLVLDISEMKDVIEINLEGRHCIPPSTWRSGSMEYETTLSTK